MTEPLATVYNCAAKASTRPTASASTTRRCPRSSSAASASSSLDRRERQRRQRRWQLGLLRPRRRRRRRPPRRRRRRRRRWPKTCWRGRPALHRLDGGEYDFHGLGVHDDGELVGPDGRTGHVQTYHCPVICGDDIGSTDWFPCGACRRWRCRHGARRPHDPRRGRYGVRRRRAAGDAARVGEYRESVPGILKGARLIDNDPDYKTR